MNEGRVRRMMRELRVDPTALLFAQLLGLGHELDPGGFDLTASGQSLEFLLEHPEAGGFPFTAWP